MGRVAGSSTKCHRAPLLPGLGWLDLVGSHCPWLKIAPDLLVLTNLLLCVCRALSLLAVLQPGCCCKEWGRLLLSRETALQDYIQEHWSFPISSANYCNSATASSAMRPHGLAESREHGDRAKPLVSFCWPIMLTVGKIYFLLFHFPWSNCFLMSHICFDCRLKVSAEVKIKNANYSSGKNKCINTIIFYIKPTEKF